MTTNTPNKPAHAKFSPSSSHRWLNCSAYQKFLETLPEQMKPTQHINEAAREGSAAHRLAELCYKLDHDPKIYLGKNVVLDGGDDFLVNQEICDGVQVYLQYIDNLLENSSALQEWGFEDKVKIEHKSQELYGTCDFWADQSYKGFDIVDFKFGRQDVSPEDNPQLLYYAVGAIESEHGSLESVKKHIHDPNKFKIRLTIVQPRSLTVSNSIIKTWETDIDYLIAFKEKLLKGIDLCCGSKLVFSVGEWCRYCPAAHLCPILSNKIYETTKALVKTDDLIIPCAADLSPVELKKALDLANVIEGWVKDVRTYAERELKNGKTIEGYKLVDKKGYRKWKDEKNVKKVLTTLGDKLYSERKLITPAQAEKLGVDKETVSQLSTRFSSGTKIAKTTDQGTIAKKPPTVLEAFKVIK